MIFLNQYVVNDWYMVNVDDLMSDLLAKSEIKSVDQESLWTFKLHGLSKVVTGHGKTAELTIYKNEGPAERAIYFFNQTHVLRAEHAQSQGAFSNAARPRTPRTLTLRPTFALAIATLGVRSKCSETALARSDVFVVFTCQNFHFLEKRQLTGHFAVLHAETLEVVQSGKEILKAKLGFFAGKDSLGLGAAIVHAERDSFLFVISAQHTVFLFRMWLPVLNYLPQVDLLG
jgi:hypothetical protein